MTARVISELYNKFKLIEPKKLNIKNLERPKKYAQVNNLTSITDKHYTYMHYVCYLYNWIVDHVWKIFCK